MWEAIAASGGANLIGSQIMGGATKDAARSQAEASGRALNENSRQFDIARADLASYRQAGQESIARMRTLLGLGDPNEEARGRAAAAAGLKKPTWDDAAGEHLKQHIAGFGVGYTGGSDPAARQQQTQAIYDAMLANYNAKAAQLVPGGAGGVPGGDYGALTRKFTMDDFNADPVAQAGLNFGLEEGDKSIRRMFGARGLGRSGAASKALTRFGTDYGLSKAGESRSRFLQDQDVLYNRLAGIAGTGQTATTNTAQLGAGAAARAGDIITGDANARGAAAIAGGTLRAGMIQNFGNTAAGLYTLDRVFPKPKVPDYMFDDMPSGYGLQ